MWQSVWQEVVPYSNYADGEGGLSCFRAQKETTSNLLSWIVIQFLLHCVTLLLRRLSHDLSLFCSCSITSTCKLETWCAFWKWLSSFFLYGCFEMAPFRVYLCLWCYYTVIDRVLSLWRHLSNHMYSMCTAYMKYVFQKNGTFIWKKHKMTVNDEIGFLSIQISVEIEPINCLKYS